MEKNALNKIAMNKMFLREQDFTRKILSMWKQMITFLKRYQTKTFFTTQINNPIPGVLITIVKRNAPREPENCSTAEERRVKATKPILPEHRKVLSVRKNFTGRLSVSMR